MAKKQAYGNESITTLKGAERVRKRPAVIFGSDGLDGCEHAVFEILSNAIDEAREGYGKLIIVTRYADRSIEVEDFGRGCPVDWNEKEQRYNWELVFCEMYAGGKYNNNASENYEYSLGLNGLGTCATQYASEYFNARIFRDGFEYHLHFKRGEIDGQMEKRARPTAKRPAHVFHWKPDLEVFTDIDIPVGVLSVDTLKRQAVVNAGVTFTLPQSGRRQVRDRRSYCYDQRHPRLCQRSCTDEQTPSPCRSSGRPSASGRDREDKPEYKVTHFRGAVLLATVSTVWNTITTPLGSSTAARRKRPSRMRVCLRHRRLSASRRTNTRSPNRRSRSRTWRTVWCW